MQPLFNLFSVALAFLQNRWTYFIALSPNLSQRKHSQGVAKKCLSMLAKQALTVWWNTTYWKVCSSHVSMLLLQATDMKWDAKGSLDVNKIINKLDLMVPNYYKIHNLFKDAWNMYHKSPDNFKGLLSYKVCSLTMVEQS